MRKFAFIWLLAIALSLVAINAVVTFSNERSLDIIVASKEATTEPGFLFLKYFAVRVKDDRGSEFIFADGSGGRAFNQIEIGHRCHFVYIGAATLVRVEDLGPATGCGQRQTS